MRRRCTQHWWKQCDCFLFCMEITYNNIIMQFRRSVASHWSLYRVLSLCSLPVVGGGTGGALSARLMKAGRQAFREESVCSTAWQSQPPSISIIHIHMPVGREQLLRERTRGRWHGCGGEGGEGGTACQTPITVVPSSCSSSTCACQSCVKE